MRIPAVSLCAGVLAMLCVPKPAPPLPKPDPLEAKVERLEAKNRQLAVRLRRERRGNRYHARQVRRLRAALRARVAFGPFGVVSGFLCIHGGEGAWTSRTGNGYYGGLQMDGSFMRSYGGNFLRELGTADRWPPFVQVAVAMNAYYSGRGWYPWPNTARECGLL